MRVVAEPSPREWIERALDGEEEAFAALYDLLAPEIKRYLVGLQLPLSQQDHEDALQETFLRLLRGLDGFERSRSLTAYALGIARFVALDMGRRGPPRPGATGVERAAPDSTSEQVVEAEERALVAEAFRALEPELRSVLTLRHASGLTMKQVAEALACSVPTARVRLRDASHRLALELRRLGVVPREVSP